MTALQPKEEEEGEASQLQESEAVGSREDTHDLRAAALPAHPQSSRGRNIHLLCRRRLGKQNIHPAQDGRLQVTRSIYRAPACFASRWTGTDIPQNLTSRSAQLASIFTTSRYLKTVSKRF